VSGLSAIVCRRRRGERCGAVGVWRVAGLLGAILSATLCAPVAASAAPGPPPGKDAPSTTTQRRAKAKFEEGLALSDEAKWQDALAAFRESNGLVPMAVVQFNIAVTLRALGRYVECKQSGQKSLDDITDGLLTIKQPKIKSDIEGVLKECKQKVALVGLKVAPADGTVEVDGAAPDKLPDGRLEVDPGRHVFVLTASGYQTTTVTKEIESGETEVALTAPPIPKAKPVVGNGAPAEEESTPWYESGWFWGVTGGVVAAGAAVVVIVVLTRPSEQTAAEPPPGTVDHVIPAAIRW
jgi:hypothetical protein